MVRNMYRKLARSWGQQHWWPAETPFEVIVGAILTQNTSWTNVERAIASLRAAGPITIRDVANVATSFPGFVALAQSVGLKIRQDAI